MRWIVTQLGARQHYAIPVSLHRLGHLRAFFTEAWNPLKCTLFRSGPRFLRAFSNRHHPDLPNSAVHAVTLRSTVFRLMHDPGLRGTTAQRYDYWGKQGSWFATKVASKLAECYLDPDEDHFFAFNSAALETLQLMKQRGVFTVVDQVDPAREEEVLVRLEREKWPGWERDEAPVPNWYWERVRAEWDIADLIVVNSEWSKSLLVRQGASEKKVHVIPLAYDCPTQHARRTAPNGKLRVLWLGSVILRKGIPYLIEAARRLPSVEFLVAGPIGVSKEKLKTAPRNITFTGRVQRDQTPNLYEHAHVFAVPTISDGFAITQLEAMAYGLPVVATANCGRVVTHGVDGFIVPAGNAEALASAIAKLDDDRKTLAKMSECALEKWKSFQLPGNAVQIEASVRAHRVSHPS